METTRYVKELESVGEPSFLVFAFLYHWFFSASMIAPFECVLQQDRSSIMLRNPSVRCYNSEWYSYYPTAIWFILLWAVFSPNERRCFVVFLQKESRWSSSDTFPRSFDEDLSKNSFLLGNRGDLVFFILGLKLLPLRPEFSYLGGSFFVACMLVIYILIDSIFLYLCSGCIVEFGLHRRIDKQFVGVPDIHCQSRHEGECWLLADWCSIFCYCLHSCFCHVYYWKNEAT